MSATNFLQGAATWILGLPPTITAAIVAGSISVLVTRLNNHDQKRLRDDEHKKKRREWFLEKQARDVEEIITALDSFSKRLTEHLSKIDYHAHQSIGMIDAHRETEVNQERKRIAIETVQSLYKRLTEEEWDTVDSWFTHDAQRLTIWLEDSNSVANELASLGSEFRFIHGRLVEVAQLASDIANPEILARLPVIQTRLQEKEEQRKRMALKFGEPERKVAEEYMPQWLQTLALMELNGLLEPISDRARTLIKEIVRVERDLIETLRDDKPQKVAWRQWFKVGSGQ